MAFPVARLALTVELTSFCNQRCAHCYHAFEHTPARALPTDELVCLLERALSEVPFERVTLCGGEPLAYGGLFEVLELCAARGVTAHIASNATLITDEMASRLAGFASTAVQVPLNGPVAKVHDATVGVPGAWERAVRGIERLRSHGVVTVGCIVITHYNAALVGATLDRMRELGIASAALSRLLAGGASAQSLDLLPTRGDLLEAFRQASAPRFSGAHPGRGGSALASAAAGRGRGRHKQDRIVSEEDGRRPGSGGQQRGWRQGAACGGSDSGSAGV